MKKILFFRKIEFKQCHTSENGTFLYFLKRKLFLYFGKQKSKKKIIFHETELSYILDKGIFRTLEYLRLEAYLEP